MSVITLTERGRGDDGVFSVAVEFEGGGEHLAKVADPLVARPDGEQLLTWYFEEHLRYPHLDSDRERSAVDLLTTYGGELFEQVFGATEGCRFEFQRVRAAGFDDLRLEIIGGVDFHRLHWEAMREAGSGTPFGVRVPILRRVENLDIGFDVSAQGSTLNVLVVTARPNGAQDVGYRTISRPLLKALRNARIPVSVDLVRPGSWRALQKHLQAVSAKRGSGWYRIVHFDVHGALASVDQMRASQAGEGLLLGDGASEGDGDEDAYLFFETAKEGVSEAVPTEKVANLLVEHRVPVAVLNACQSAMQSGGSEASLAQRLVEAGVPVAVGMSYSVTVSAAELMMPVIYEQLAEGVEILAAIHAGRRELFDVPTRHAYFDQQLDLQDWILPVVFSQRPVEMQPQPANPEQEQEIYTEKAWQVEEPRAEYGFVGRDLDVQAIERHLLGEEAHNQLLISGMAGAGKSTLLGHLAWWWQATGLVERVFSFSYENRAWSVDQILQAIIAELLDGHEQVLAQNLSDEARLERVAALLRTERHLLILDNAESISAAPASIPHSLPADERARLGKFLSRLRGGKTLVLLGSRGPEQWLAGDSFGSNTYELGGLDPQATSILLERIVTRHGGALPDSAAERGALTELVEVLGGYPLALTVVLPAIATAPPSAVLAELKHGGEGADPAKIIQRAVEFSHDRLEPTTQSSLVVLAPFTGVVPKVGLDTYAGLLGKHEAIRELGTLDLDGALQQATSVGLATPDPESPDHIRLQPLFPFFLRTRLADQPELVAAAAEAHHGLYQQLGPSLHRLLLSREARDRAVGRILTRGEYANLMTALDYALDADEPLRPLVWPLEEYLDQVGQEHARQQLLERVISAIGEPGSKERREELATMHNLAGIAALARHRLPEARVHHEAELRLREEVGDRERSARTYHQLGIVAEEERSFEDAEAHYKEALAIKLEFKDRRSAGSTYHQLGIVAHQGRRFDEAEESYKEAIAIFDEFGDRYESAATHHQLGVIAQQRRSFEDAEAHYKEALAIKLEFKDRRAAAITYHQLGTILNEQHRFEEAEGHYKEALAIFDEFGDRYSAANIYHQLGIAAQGQMRFEEAEAHYRKALAIFAEFENRYSAASTYHQLGIAVQHQQRYEEAEGYYREALKIFEEFKDPYETGSTYHQMGTVMHEQERAEEAEGYYREALKIKLKFSDRRSAAITYHQLGVVAEGHQHFEEAEGRYREALAIFDEFNDPYRAASSRSQLGILLTRQGRVREGLGYSLIAVLTRLEITSQWYELDLCWLKRQRKLLGEEDFQAEVVRVSSEEVGERLPEMLDRVEEPPE